jgi:nucleolar protein 12
MLPRELRVTRCKAPHKTARAMEARGQRSTSFADRKGKGGGKFDSRKRGGKPETGQYVPKPTAESQTLAGRASKLLGRFGAAQLAGKPPGGGGAGAGKSHGPNSKKRQDRKELFMNRAAGGGGGAGEAGAGAGAGEIKGPEQFVFEGRRASSKDGKPKDLRFKGANKGKDPRHKKRSGGKFGGK